MRWARGPIRISFTRRGFVFAMDFRSAEAPSNPVPIEAEAPRFVEGTFSRGGWNPNPRTLRPDVVIAPLDPRVSRPVPPLVPGKYNKGGRNTEPLPPRPDRSPRPMGLPGWVVQQPQSPHPPKP